MATYTNVTENSATWTNTTEVTPAERLLLEDGVSILLQEIGDKIMLEGGGTLWTTATEN